MMTSSGSDKTEQLIERITRLEHKLAAIRQYAQESLDQVTDPSSEDYQPGDEETADMLISSRWILKMCDEGVSSS